MKFSSKIISASKIHEEVLEQEFAGIRLWRGKDWRAECPPGSVPGGENLCWNRRELAFVLAIPALSRLFYAMPGLFFKSMNSVVINIEVHIIP